jgi:ribosome-associated protein
LNSQQKAQQKELSTEELNALIIDSIQDIKGKNLLKLDLRQLDDAPASFFIICEGDSNTQVKAISENIHLRLKNEAGESPAHYEGQTNSLWICMDYFDIVVHIFYKDTRNYYELEGLWSDAIFTEYENL